VRVLLVNPPTMGSSESYDLLKISMPPLGLAYIAAAAEQEGHSVSILDCAALGLDMSEAEHRIRKSMPEIVGVTSTTPQIERAMEVVRLAKKAVPGVWTVAGGPHVTMLPEQTLAENQDLDFCVIGEGESSFVQLAEVLERARDMPKKLENIRGIAFRQDNGSIVRTQRRKPEDLEQLPLPARHLLPMKQYQVLGKKGLVPNVLSSRGCAYSCIFCLTPCIFGRYRARSAESVVDEIETIHSEYGFSKFEFSDDLFTRDPKRVKKICDLMRSRGLDLEWGCSARVDLVDRDLLGAMKRAGCSYIYYGVESGTQRILDFIRKGTNISQINRAFKITKKAGIEIIASFMMGFPGETKKDVERTISFARKLAPSYAQFSIATPYPGTVLYKMVRRAGMLLPKAWSDYTATKVLIKLKELPEKQIERLFRKAYESFYLSPRFLISHLAKGHLELFKFVWRFAISRARGSGPPEARENSPAL